MALAERLSVLQTEVDELCEQSEESESGREERGVGK